MPIYTVCSHTSAGTLADIGGVVCVTNYRLFFIDDAASVCHCRCGRIELRPLELLV